MSKWVQHKSGQGEKYVAEDEDMYTWKVPIKERYSNLLRWDLPKSEYIECSPPEEWGNVTHCFYENDLTLTPHIGSGYRLRKVVLRSDDIDYKQKLVNAFIVEKRKS